MQTTTINGRASIITAGNNTMTGEPMFCLFATEANARDEFFDVLVVGTVDIDELSDDQIDIALENSNELGNTP